MTLPETVLPSLPTQEQEAPTGIASGSWQVIVAVLQFVLLGAASILRLFGGGGPPNGRSIVVSAAMAIETLKTADTPAAQSQPNAFIGRTVQCNFQPLSYQDALSEWRSMSE